MSLVTNTPRLIQRCEIEENPDSEKSGIRYDYMGSSEFECGDQVRSLEAMFKHPLAIRSCSIISTSNPELGEIRFFLIANDTFSFRLYRNILAGLVDEEWHLQEPIWLVGAIKRARGIEDRDYCPGRLHAWFDFVNGVFFTLTEERAQYLRVRLLWLKNSWENPKPESPEIVAFKHELEVVKSALQAAGKEWFSLSRVEDGRGPKGDEVRVWLNPMEQQKYNCGFYSIEDLRDWISDQGPIVKKQPS